MPKHLKKQTRLSVYKDLSEPLTCPDCGRIVNVVVPAVTFTYLVHGKKDICVIDNQPVSLFDEEMKHG